jgi:hypothetical protein
MRHEVSTMIGVGVWSSCVVGSGGGMSCVGGIVTALSVGAILVVGFV